MIHIGQKIKEIVYKKKIQINEFARKLGKSRAVIYDIFDRETVDTGLLTSISEALDYNFFQHYISTDRLEEPSPEPYGKKAMPEIEAELELKNLQLQNANKEIEYLKKIVLLLEKGETK